METNVHLLQQWKDKMPQNKCNKKCYSGDLELRVLCDIREAYNFILFKTYMKENLKILPMDDKNVLGNKCTWNKWIDIPFSWITITQFLQVYEC